MLIAIGSKELLSSFLILILFKSGVDVVSWSIEGLGWWGYTLIVQIMWPTLPLLSLQANFRNLPLPPKILPHFLPEKMMPAWPTITAFGKQPERCDACVTCCHCSWQTEKCDACGTHCHRSWQTAREVWCLCDPLSPLLANRQGSVVPVWPTVTALGKQPGKCGACVTCCHRSWQTAREVWCLCDPLSLLLANSQRSVMPMWPAVTALGKQPEKCYACVTCCHRCWQTARKVVSMMPVWPTVTALRKQPEKCDACVTCCHCSWQTARNINQWCLCEPFLPCIKNVSLCNEICRTRLLGWPWASQLVVCWAGPYLRWQKLQLQLFYWTLQMWCLKHLHVFKWTWMQNYLTRCMHLCPLLQVPSTVTNTYLWTALEWSKLEESYLTPDSVHWLATTSQTENLLDVTRLSWVTNLFLLLIQIYSCTHILTAYINPISVNTYLENFVTLRAGNNCIYSSVKIK